MGDYHRARVHALKEVRPDLDIFTADLGNKDNLYQWNNTSAQNHFCLSAKPANRFDFRRLSGFMKLLSQNEIDTVCISGYGRAEYLFFLIYAKLSGRNVILFAESWYPSISLIDFVKSVFLKTMCDGFLVSGQRAFDHFTKRLNIAKAKVKVGYSVVDNAHFALKKSESFERKRILLCIARFAREKNLLLLIRGFEQSKMPMAGWELHLVGGGPQKQELVELVKKAMTNSVQLVDWQSYDQLPHLYLKASVFILPSLFEPWGLVVNEAMAASLPVVLSDKVGCLPDLLKVENNGWSFHAEDEKELILILNQISEKEAIELAAMGNKSKECIESFSPTLFARNLIGLIGPSMKNAF